MTWNLLHNYKPWEQSIDGNFDGSFADLDLSAKVPSNSLALVTLISTNGGELSFRPNGTSEDFSLESELSGNWGIYRGRHGNENDLVPSLVQLDENSIIELAGTNTSGADIKVLGYLDAEVGSGTLSGQTGPASWTDLDLSSYVGSNSAMVSLRVEMTSGVDGTEVFFRENGETNDITGGISTTTCNQGYSYVVIVPTDANGVVEWQRSAAATFDIEVLSYMTTSNGWTTNSTTVYSSAAAPTSWTTLDLSSVVGDVPAFVLLRVDVASGSATTNLTFRPRSSPREYQSSNDNHGMFTGYGDDGTSIYIAVPTDVMGEVDWIRTGTANNCAVTFVGYVVGSQPPASTGLWFSEEEEAATSLSISNGSWTTIDFSPWVGENRTAVYISSEIVAGSTGYWSFRPGGDTDDWYHGAGFDDGGTSRCYMQSGGAADRRYLMLQTGADGTVEVQSDGPDTMTATLYGFLTSVYSGSSIGSGESISASYTKTDISSIVGSNSGVALCKCSVDANVHYGYRVVDDSSANYLKVDSFTGYPTRIDYPASGIKTTTLAIIDSSGNIDYAGTGNANLTHEVQSYASGMGSGSTVVRSLAVGTGSPVDLDLSSEVGEDFALCIMKVRRGSNSSTSRYKFGISPASDTPLLGTNRGNGVTDGRIMGETNSIVIVPTDKSGVISYDFDTTADWELTLLDYFGGNPAPELGAGLPTGSSESPGVTVSIPWTDVGGMSETGTNVTLTDPDLVVHNVVVNGVFQSGYGGTIPTAGGTAGTIQVSTHPDFAAGSWSADVTIQDQGLLTDTANWSFSVTDTNYINRVRSLVDGNEFITWITADAPDPSGTSFPGPGTFGVDTADYCVNLVTYIVKEYRNRARDLVDDNIYYWTTSTPDTSGSEFPGPGGYAGMTEYVVHEIIYYNQ